MRLWTDLYPPVTWQVYLLFIIPALIIFLLVLRHSRRARDGAGQKYHQKLQLYVEALDELPECILIADATDRLLFANSAVLNVLNKTMGEVLGMSLFALLFQKPREAETTRQVLKREGNYQGKVNYPFRKDEDRTIEVSISAVEQSGDDGVRYIGILRDVTTRTIAEAKREDQHRRLVQLATERSENLEQKLTDKTAIQAGLEGSLEEKSRLLKEIYLRTSSNMQVITSLLNMQADRVSDAKVSELFSSSRRRVEAIDLVHENLYQSESLTSIDFGEYVDLLSSRLCRSFAKDGLRLHLEVDIKDIFLNIETAIPCGLIINELVTNSLQHAFVGHEGTITIAIVQHGSDYVMTVADNGVGLPDDFRDKTSPSKGMEIVAILATQLNGSLTHSGSSGTRFELRFPGATALYEPSLKTHHPVNSINRQV